MAGSSGRWSPSTVSVRPPAAHWDRPLRSPLTRHTASRMPGRRGDTPVAGREEELRLFVRAVERAEAGEPSTVLLSGDAGIGKSTLLTEAAKVAGADLFTGRCVHVGG